MKIKKRKIVFVGDVDSINIEIIVKSHKNLSNKIEYIVVGCIKEFKSHLSKLNFDISINEIYDPLNFQNYKKNYINFYHISHISKKKSVNILNQINICNTLAKLTKFDLVTMPINKHLIKKTMEFNGVTEYLGKINKSKTIMLMLGENFSVIPITTHINPKYIYKYISLKFLKEMNSLIFKLIKKSLYQLSFKNINYLCYNPHCGENGTLGLEDIKIKKIIPKSKNKFNLMPADSAFLNYKKNSLFISTYHDQALIPFKILNKRAVNLTLGLNYRRISPAHGTAKEIKLKNIANNTSYLECMAL